MFEELRHATDKNGHPITQSLFDEIVAALRAIVAQYDAMPDGELGRGLTNGPFLAARDALARLDS